MDGEVNNRTARIAQDVKRDEQQETDADETQTQQTQTNTDRHNRRRRTQTDTTDADAQDGQTQTRRITRDGHKEGERLSVGNELTSRRGLME